MGGTIAFFALRIPLKPVNQIIDRLKKLSEGDFDTEIEFSPLMNKLSSFSELSESFNRLAKELKNTEMLRGDFINNFSHEFKTPIVSIAGFAKLLKKDSLSDTERVQYLNAIEEESLRLSYMATNVLNMTKLENQTILTDLSEFNISEQLRSSILLLESKWSQKEIDLRLELDEYDIVANEEMLKQVWINLFDNAVKFVPNGGIVFVEIYDEGEGYTVKIGNSGSEIPADKLDKIWRKFYQADESHKTEGNGIGLAIVKRIIKLHNGRISVVSENNVTVFSVYIPKKQ
jgi:signal transduction histidine kinase